MATVQERRRKSRREALARVRARHDLAKLIGLYVLNTVEHGGQIYIRDYRRVTPRWVLARLRPGE